MNKILNINQDDPRLSRENNTGEGMPDEQFEQEKMLEPKEIDLYRKLMIEANTQLGFISLPKEVYGQFENLIKHTTYN